MKTNHKILLSFFLAISLLFSLAGCSKNPRDVKVSQLTIEQRDNALKTLTIEETKLLESYELRTSFAEIGKAINEMSDLVSSVFSQVIPSDTVSQDKPSAPNTTKKDDLKKQSKENENLDLSINEMIQSQRDFEKNKK